MASMGTMGMGDVDDIIAADSAPVSEPDSSGDAMAAQSVDAPPLLTDDALLQRAGLP